MSTQAISNGPLILQPDAEVSGIKLYIPPAQVLSEAREAAKVLHEAIQLSKNPPIKFGDNEHLLHEHWALLGHFYGYSTKIEWSRPITFEGDNGKDICGYEAAALLINERTGAIVGRAEAMCLDEEESWGEVTQYQWKETFDADGNKLGRAKVAVGTKDKPLFQLRSMAETRASSQAYRRKLDWIAVLAGYAPTPSEDMPREARQSSGKSASDLPEKLERKPAQSSTPITPDYSRRDSRPVQRSSERTITDAQARRFYALWMDAGKTKEEAKTYLREVMGVEKDNQIPVSRYQEACAWAQRKSR